MSTCRDCPTELIHDESVPPECRTLLCKPCKRKTQRAAEKRRRARKPKKPGPQKKDLPLSVRIRQHVDIKKSGPCTDCGGTFPPVAMDFDHRPNEIKLKEVSKISTFAAVDAEIAKCDLVCANCHRVRTYQRGQHKPL